MKAINRDTFKHIAVSFLLFIFMEMATQSVITGMTIVITLGFLKEALDQLKKNKNTYLESLTDMVANAAGILMGYCAYIIFLQ